MCIRDEIAGLKDIKLELSLLKIELGQREEECLEETADLKKYLITKLAFKEQVEVSGAHVYSLDIIDT